MAIAIENISKADLGKEYTITPIRRNELEINEKQKVMRLPFRSTGYYFTRNMWIDSNTLIFETILNPQSSGMPMDPNYTMIWKGIFLDNEVRVQLIVPPEESAKFLQAYLSPSKKTFYYITKAGIFKLNLTNLTRTQIFDFKSFQNTHVCLSSALTCDEKEFYFLTWKILPQNQPNGQIFRINLQTNESEIIDTFQSPYLKVHLDGSPVDPKLIHYSLVKETNYPKITEIDPRLWIMNTKDLKSYPLYKHQRKGLFRQPEVVTHEAWGYDGKYLTAIVRRNWIKQIFIADRQSRVIMDGSKGGQNPWHCDGKNGKLFVFDTMNRDTGLWLGEFDSQKLCHLCKTDQDLSHQSFHPHPFFSPNLDRVIFNSKVGSDAYLHYVQTDL